MFIWDYDISELKRTENGRAKILERMINYGIYGSDEEKISLRLVKKYWGQLRLEPKRKRLFELLIWGK